MLRSGCLKILFLALAGSGLFAQIGKPMPVTYRCLGQGHELGSLTGITWGEGGETWRAEFRFPKGWWSADEVNRPIPAIQGEVTDPNGRRQSIQTDLSGIPIAFESVNAATSGQVEWEQPYFEGYGSKPIHFAESCERGDWCVMRVLWRTGGCSGDPPMFFLLVALHRPSNRWAAYVDYYDHPPTPDRGDAMRMDFGKDSTFSLSWWERETRSTCVLRGWQISFREGSLVRTELPRHYMLFTHTGIVATLADTPFEARHFGYQEVAWNLVSWDTKGGRARAFSATPRRYQTAEDRQGAPMLPRPGVQPFRWAAELYVVPWGAKPQRLPLPEALARLKKGRWDVVLFRNASEPPLAMRLVEHHRDFPHSTPPVKAQSAS